jgi:hypothetical protein
LKVNFTPTQMVDQAIVFRTPSETRQGVMHYTFKLRHGGIVCTCEGWQFRGTCKHATNLDLSECGEILAEWRKSNP